MNYGISSLGCSTRIGIFHQPPYAVNIFINFDRWASLRWASACGRLNTQTLSYWGFSQPKCPTPKTPN